MEKKGMNKFTAKVAKFVLKYRLLIILLNILILGALFMGMMKRVGEFGEHVAYMQNLRNNPLEVDSNHVAPPPIMDFDYHVFFEDDNRDMVEYDEFQRIFSKEENLTMMLNCRTLV